MKKSRGKIAWKFCEENGTSVNFERWVKIQVDGMWLRVVCAGVLVGLELR